MKLLTPLQAYELEEKSIKELPISSGQLMENAGESVAIKAIEMIKGIRSAVILIICGKGNNGGDGLSTALELKNKSYLMLFLFFRYIFLIVNDNQRILDLKSKE